MRASSLHGARILLVLVLGVVLFAVGMLGLREHRHPRPSAEIDVALPLFVQVVMAGGDRFLAANMGTIRALITETAKMHPDEYKILAKVQRDASWLNPAQEDNYYMAAAILSWNDQVDTAQTILQRASIARPFDWQPAFYYAFNQSHFRGDAVGAATWLRAAAAKIQDEEMRLTMENFAVRWLDQSRDLEFALTVVDSMVKQAKRKDFRDYLQVRAQRLRNLIAVRKAADTFRAQNGRPPERLEELVSSGALREIPPDPFGVGFALDSSGVPVFGKRERQ